MAAKKASSVGVVRGRSAITSRYVKQSTGPESFSR